MAGVKNIIMNTTTSSTSSTSSTALSDIDVRELHPHHAVLLKKQATINIGVIGHVAHGKSTVVSRISGQQTNRHTAEQQRNFTIYLGYANAKLYERDDKEENEQREPGANYKSEPSSFEDPHYDEIKRVNYHTDSSGVRWNLKRHVSFVDCPGHDALMATMLSGAAAMDAGLLLIAGNIRCPQPQTHEHLQAVSAMDLQDIVVVQNKIDIQPNVAETHQESIRRYLREHGSSEKIRRAPIIPTVAVRGYGLDMVIEALCNTIPTPKRDYEGDPLLQVIRSFEVNLPGTTVDDLTGGIAGGSVLRGVFFLGDTIEVRPGTIVRNEDGTVARCQPYMSTIRSMKADNNYLEIGSPGGLIAIGTDLDPILTKQNRLIGSLIGKPNKMPAVYSKIRVSYTTFETVLGTTNANGLRPPSPRIRQGDRIFITILSSLVEAEVMDIDENMADLYLRDLKGRPTGVCANVGEKIAIQMKVDRRNRLIGFGTLQNQGNVEVPIEPYR